MASFNFKYPATAHIGNKVSHAKNRSKRKFKYNLHTVTVLVDGEKQRLKVPTKMLRMLKKSGVTTHYQNTKDADKA
ncbi:MAG: bL28 family ribosomal protein [Microgenomates group bacterium]